MDNIQIYINFINTKNDKIAEYVNECFYSSKDFIKEKLIEQIRKYLTPLPIHYEWEDDGCPYDISGQIRPNGKISLNQTISEFLENEYSGNKEATYISGMGFYYNSYGDELSYFTTKIAAEIMFSAIQKYIENHFYITISEEEFQLIRDKCEGFDDIYDNCLAFDFFSYEPAIEFTDIGNILLSQI